MRLIPRRASPGSREFDGSGSENGYTDKKKTSTRRRSSHASSRADSRDEKKSGARMRGTPGPHRKSAYEEGSLDQYLRDISAYPLISRDEEVALAQRIRTHDQEALDKLVRSNLRFVVSVAKKYQNQGVSLSDLINEG